MLANFSTKMQFRKQKGGLFSSNCSSEKRGKIKKIQLLNFYKLHMIKENYTSTVTGRTALLQKRQFVGLD